MVGGRLGPACRWRGTAIGGVFSAPLCRSWGPASRPGFDFSASLRRGILGSSTYLFENTSPVAADLSIGNSLHTARSAEHPCEVGCEFLIGGGGVAYDLLDVVGCPVAVALAVGLGVLDQNIGPPL